MRLFLLPLGLSLDHDVRLSQGLWSPFETLPALLALTLALALVRWLGMRGEGTSLRLGAWLFFAVVAQFDNRPCSRPAV